VCCLSLRREVKIREDLVFIPCPAARNRFWKPVVVVEARCGRKSKQMDPEFKSSLAYLGRPCLI
jgi:hypothetical protein